MSCFSWKVFRSVCNKWCKHKIGHGTFITFTVHFWSWPRSRSNMLVFLYCSYRYNVQLHKVSCKGRSPKNVHVNRMVGGKEAAIKKPNPFSLPANDWRGSREVISPTLLPRGLPHTLPSSTAYDPVAYDSIDSNDNRGFLCLDLCSYVRQCNCIRLWYQVKLIGDCSIRLSLKSIRHLFPHALIR